MTRRRLLRALAPLSAAAVAAPARARGDSGTAHVWSDIERLTHVVELRLAAVRDVAPASAPFVESVRADLVRHRRERGSLPSSSAAELDRPASLPGLRRAIEALMHAHAEVLPALDAPAVTLVVPHMVDLARIVTVVDLWIEREEIE